MKYVLYLAVATPLLLGWLFYESATLPPQPPLFVGGIERLAPQTPVVADSGAAPEHNQLARNEGARSE